MSFSSLPPRTEERHRRAEEKHTIHLLAALLYSRLSTCYRRATGAIAIDRYGRIIGIGYNGVPRDWPHCAAILNGELPWACPGIGELPGNTQSCYAEHAEQNLIQNLTEPTENVFAVYLTTSPCKTCMVMLINLPGLEQIHYLDKYPDPEADEVFRKTKFGKTDRTRPLLLRDWSSQAEQLRKATPGLVELGYRHRWEERIQEEEGKEEGRGEGGE